MFSTELRCILVTRYLIILAHMVLLLALLMSRENNVKAGLPRGYTEDDYKIQDKDFLIDLIVSWAFIVAELSLFCTGLTMFKAFSNYFSILLHSTGTITMAYFIMEEVDSLYFWWVFGFASAAPVALDSLWCTCDMILSAAKTY